MQNFKGNVSGFKVNAVDTTGAGDAFVGALLTAVARDTSIFDVCSLFLSHTSVEILSRELSLTTKGATSVKSVRCCVKTFSLNLTIFTSVAPLMNLKHSHTYSFLI